MKKSIIYALILSFLFMGFCRKRGATIGNVDFRKLKDGTYAANAVLSGQVIVVRVKVKFKRVTNIQVLRTVPGEKGRMAIKIIDRVIHKQTLNVELIQGAEKESKAILKAIENALKKGLT